MSLNDQFEHGRIPIIPAPYREKQLAVCNEFFIDYGEDGKYHLYIAHHSDPSILIDLTSVIIKEALPNARINANQFQINIEGQDELSSLQDILNYIYKHFAKADNENGFNYAADISKVLDDATKSVLLTNTDNTPLLPITLAQNVFDSAGISLQSRLDNMTRIGFSIDYIWSETDNQTQFEFVYPFMNYTDLMEVRIGTVYIDRTRYYVINNVDEDGNYTTGTIVFINTNDFNQGIEKGRRIDLLFTYNSTYKTDSKYEYMSGTSIANSSISIVKLEKTSDSYLLNDPSSIATSAAIYNLYNSMADMINKSSNNVVWAKDISTTSNNIEIFDERVPFDNNVLINVVLSCRKNPDAMLILRSNEAAARFPLLYPDGSLPIKSFSANTTLKLLQVDGNMYILSVGLDNLHKSRYIYTCKDQEVTFSYSSLNYNIGDILNVYRNGVRLFEDLDYSIDQNMEEITLYVRTEEGERIVFEALGI